MEEINEQNLEDVKQNQNLTPIQQPETFQVQTMWNNPTLLAKAWKSAGFLAKTDFVPPAFKKPENCLIALDIANRTGMSPLAVMQNLYVVQGKPAWSGQMSIALVNGSGRFTPLDFVFVGEKDSPSFGCYATATRKSDGKVLVSDCITMQMAKDEGWTKKPGSKWLTMPVQMMQYRAGAFFARTHCPDLLIGLQTVEEIQDVKGYDANEKQTIKITLDD